MWSCRLRCPLAAPRTSAMKALLPALAGLLAALGWPALGEQRGQAEVAIQGYLLGTEGQRLSYITGVAIGFHHYYPEVGMLRGNLEGYGRRRGFRRGSSTW